MKNLTIILALLTFLFTTVSAVEWEEIKCDVKERYQNIICYRKIANKEFFVLQQNREFSSNEGKSFWVFEDSIYQKVENIEDVWANFDGTAYVRSNDSLYFYNDFIDIGSQSGTKMHDACFGKDLTISDFLFKPHIRISHHFSNTILVDLSAHGIEMHSPSLFRHLDEVASFESRCQDYAFNGKGEYFILRGKYGQPSNLELIHCNPRDNKKIIKEVYRGFSFKNKIDYEDSTVVFAHKEGLELSRDNGKTWEMILRPVNYSNNMKIYNNFIFLDVEFGILRSHDGKYWENILEGTSKAKIIDFEFDPDGRAYVYTTNGAFISKESMEDSQRAWEEDDIDLEVLITKDKKTLTINSSENIKSLEVSELKQILELISDNTYDISNLERENYFLRVEFSDKVVYKQLTLLNMTDVNISRCINKNEIKIQSNKKIKRVKASDNGRSLKHLDNGIYDISKLSYKKHFLRIEFEDNEVIYRELVKEEAEDFAVNLIVSGNKKELTIQSIFPVKRVKLGKLGRLGEHFRRLNKISNSTYDISKLDYAKHTLKIEFQDGSQIFRNIIREEPKELVVDVKVCISKQTVQIQSSKNIKNIKVYGKFGKINQISVNQFNISELPRGLYLLEIDFEDENEGKVFREIHLNEG